MINNFLNMNRYFKTEGNILYPNKDENNRHMLTWGPFYFHSIDKAQAKMDEIMEWIVNWCNEQDKTLNIKPENIIKASGGKMITFKIKAWKDEKHLVDCDALITVEDIFFEDEKEKGT